MVSSSAGSTSGANGTVAPRVCGAMSGATAATPSMFPSATAVRTVVPRSGTPRQRRDQTNSDKLTAQGIAVDAERGRGWPSLIDSAGRGCCASDPRPALPPFAPMRHLNNPGRETPVHTSTRVRRLLAGGTTLAVAATLAATLGSPAQAGLAAGSSPDAVNTKTRRDNLPNPLARKQAKLRREALELLATGKAEKEPQRAGGSTVTLSSGETVEFFDNSKQANVWTVLSEFGTQSAGRYGSDPGPLHNQIPEPD